jgi:hypothetical protein
MASPTRLRKVVTKTRVFVTSDICNEPDDAQSLVRFLLYSNEFEVCGLIAVTSTWMRHVVRPDEMVKIVRAYGSVIANLNCHVHPENSYPSEEYLLDQIKSGPAVYGKAALGDDVPLSDGAAHLIERLEESERPLWVLCWGGANCLAQALYHLQRRGDAEHFERLRTRLRVYTISDQDDTGLWIRVTFPDIFYICSVHGWNQYQLATWTGISGDMSKPMFGNGPDRDIISAAWLKKNIQIGSFGKVYPDAKFIMEGDTPTFLYLIENGLGDSEHPEWGSWGGRYNPVDRSLAARHYSDTVDKVIGNDGQTYTSNHATIWRWRDAYQNDFAARMQWTLDSDVAKANHAPVVTVNDSTDGPEALYLNVEAGTDLELDASRSYDPDGTELDFVWFQYREPSIEASGLIAAQVPELDIVVADTAAHTATVSLPPPEKCAIDFMTGKAQAMGQVFHIVLQVSDNGSPQLTTYKRVVIQVTNKDLRGGRNKTFDTVSDFLEG